MTARPLTPPEVRELLEATDLVRYDPPVTGWTIRKPGDLALAIIFDVAPEIRATLERYAELAEEKGE